MSYNSFDNVVLEISYLRSDFWGQLAFAATCAERLFPFYRCYTAQEDWDADPYSSALNYVWRCLETMENNEDMVRQLVVECEKLLPNEDDAWQEGCPYAEDATATVIYCLRFFLSGDQQEVIWVARRAYEVADNFIVNNTDINTGNQEGELDILHHPIIQNELARQIRDLQELRHTSADVPAFQALCRILRQRANEEAIKFFNSHSSAV